MNTTSYNQGSPHPRAASSQSSGPAASRPREQFAWDIPQETPKEEPLFTGRKDRAQAASAARQPASGRPRASRGPGAASTGGFFSRRARKAAAAPGPSASCPASRTAGASARPSAAQAGANVAKPRRAKRPVGTTNLLKYAADNRVVRAVYALTSGPRLPIFILVVAIAVVAALYFPARDYYVAWRTNDILTQQLAIREKYNKSLQKDVDAMFTQEGIEDAARAKLGLVQEGEKTITVTGDGASGDEGSSDSASTGSSDEPSTSAEVERAEQAVMDDSPWYLEWLDDLFGFDGTGGMAVVSTGDK